MIDFTAAMMTFQGGGQILTILIIVGTAGIVSKEHSQGTIKFLLIRARSRTAILASKYVVVLLFTLTLTILATISSFISGAIWFGLSGGEAAISDVAMNIMYSSVNTVVFATLAFMVGILTNSTGVTIGGTIFLMMIHQTIIPSEYYKYVLFPNLNLAAYEGGGAPMPGMTLTFSIVKIGRASCRERVF